MLESQRRYNKRLTAARKKRQIEGLCRHCDLQVCARSKVFCEKHLGQHSKGCIVRMANQSLVDHKYYLICRRPPVEISKVDFVSWYDAQPKVCCYCGVEESMLATQKDKKKRKLTIDRMDNDIAYKTGNLCLACFRCNHFKSDFFTFDQWKDIADRLIRPRLDEYHHL